MSNSTSSQNKNIIFECDQHATNIYEKLQRFYDEKDFLDTVLIVGNDCIKIAAHKIVLCALSDYFWEIFHGCHTTTSKINEVQLEQLEASSLKFIIDYMYSGSIELNLEKIEAILRSAVFLKMKNLINGCCDYLEKNLDNSNCLHWLRLAKELGLSGLQEKSSNLIYTHLEKIMKQPEFLLLNTIELKDLLFNDNPRGDLEEKVFQSLVTWVQYEKLDRQHLQFELLSMVRYQYLTPKFIVENSTSVSRTVESYELILSWLKYHLSPESRTIEQKNITSTYEPEPEPRGQSKIAGIRINSTKEAEIVSYDPTLENWIIEKRSRPLSTKKSENNNSKIVIDEKLFIVGGMTNDGTGTISNSVECLDLKTFKLTDLPAMRIARYESQLANLNGHLCVFAGFAETDRKTFIDSVEIFNFSTGKWSDLEPPFKPDERSKVVGHNGILYIFDFRYGCLQCYDVSSNQWTSTEQPIDDSVRDFRSAAVGNFVYAICIGQSVDIYENRCYHTYKKTLLKRFNLSNNTWYQLAELTKNQSLIKMVTVAGDKILCHKDNNDIVEYNLNTKEFTTLGNLCGFPFKL